MISAIGLWWSATVICSMFCHQSENYPLIWANVMLSTRGKWGNSWTYHLWPYLVTRSMQQASRLDKTASAVIWWSLIILSEMFNPQKQRTEDYITGKWISELEWSFISLEEDLEKLHNQSSMQCGQEVLSHRPAPCACHTWPWSGKGEVIEDDAEVMNMSEIGKKSFEMITSTTRFKTFEPSWPFKQPDLEMYGDHAVTTQKQLFVWGTAYLLPRKKLKDGSRCENFAEAALISTQMVL